METKSDHYLNKRIRIRKTHCLTLDGLSRHDKFNSIFLQPLQRYDS